MSFSFSLFDYLELKSLLPWINEVNKNLNFFAIYFPAELPLRPFKLPFRPVAFVCKVTLKDTFCDFNGGFMALCYSVSVRSIMMGLLCQNYQ